MRVLRSVIPNQADLDAAEREARYASIQPDPLPCAKSKGVQRLMAIQSGLARDAQHLADIVASRPLGVDAPRDEPKSIDDPTPPGRLRFEAPRKRYVSPKPYKSPF
jgi:hypothetical protein